MSNTYLIQLSEWDIQHSKVDQVAFAELQKIVASYKKYTDLEDFKLRSRMHTDVYEIELDNFLDKCDGVPFEVKGKVVYREIGDTETTLMLENMAKKLNSFEHTIAEFSHSHGTLAYNLGKNPVVINVNNDRLLAINDVMELPEASVEDIQEAFSDGYRIITAFVERTYSENGDALPTYMMGRHVNTVPVGKEL